MRSFLGLAGYYCKFIQIFSKITAPLTNLTKKVAKFEWTNKCEEAFQELKKILTSTSVLSLPGNEEHFAVYNYASRSASIYIQGDREIAYTSPNLKPHEHNYQPTI